ncbi:4'-phosphopantetheinyl transferase family protein [Pseudoclavibacter terrae]|uniref:4-phosphopantetheinyl transferase family protein n=1 Tax=Pseudoclavibacter terrae TaxID=1530195 RepID=A0A7J5AY77_9MICO|nr:4'-phosphopantetheinyl transferase superfamily protein [Pseudoclavibacter terrae]KAB1636445.1 4-phosphopantetheinyl transferase family protein [Pseudoclavibacter terrae]
MQMTERLLGSVLIVSADARALGGRDRLRALEVLSEGDRHRLRAMSEVRADDRADAFLTGRLLVQLGLERLSADHFASDLLATDLEMGSTLPDGVHAIRKRGTHLESGERGLAPVAALEVVCSNCGSTTHGKPSMPGLPVLISLAYAGTTVFVALASADDVSALGIDVEELRIDEDSASARPAGALPISGAGPGADPDRDAAPRAPSGDAVDPALDLEWWTAVEAVLKADGRGLRVDSSLVRFEPGEGRADGDEHARVAGEEASYRIHRAVAERFLVAVATRKPDRETSLVSEPANEGAESPSL